MGGSVAAQLAAPPPAPPAAPPAAPVAPPPHAAAAPPPPPPSQPPAAHAPSGNNTDVRDGTGDPSGGGDGGGGGGGNVGGGFTPRETDNSYSEYKDWYLDFPRRKPLTQKPERDHAVRFDQYLPQPSPREPDFRTDIYRSPSTPRRAPRASSILDGPPPPLPPVSRSRTGPRRGAGPGSDLLQPPANRRAGSVSPLDDPDYQRAFIVHPRDESKVQFS